MKWFYGGHLRCAPARSSKLSEAVEKWSSKFLEGAQRIKIMICVIFLPRARRGLFTSIPPSPQRVPISSGDYPRAGVSPSARARGAAMTPCALHILEGIVGREREREREREERESAPSKRKGGKGKGIKTCPFARRGSHSHFNGGRSHRTRGGGSQRPEMGLHEEHEVPPIPLFKDTQIRSPGGETSARKIRGGSLCGGHRVLSELGSGIVNSGRPLRSRSRACAYSGASGREGF